jgi:NTE family protein
MENRINALQLKDLKADVLIRPDLDHFNMLEFHRAEEAIAAGEKAARNALPLLRGLRGS